MTTPQQPLYDFGGSGRTIHLALANGFPPQTYRPLLAPLTARWRVVCLPPRPLWNDPPPPESITSWRALADDVLAGMRAYGLDEVIAVGHSFGCVVSMLAAVAEPSRFRALIMLDPTILPPNKLERIGFRRAVGVETRSPLVQGALKRKRSFADADEAFAYWRGKPLFAQWPDEVLRLYVESITRPAGDGGLELTWSPEWESRGYETIFTGTWREISKLRRLKLPLLVVRGTTSNTFLEAAARRMRLLLPDMSYAEVPEHGHLFPHSAPDETRHIIEDWLTRWNL